MPFYTNLLDYTKIILTLEYILKHFMQPYVLTGQEYLFLAK